MTDHDPHNRQDEGFHQPRTFGERSSLDQVCDWMRANGIDPAHVSADARASMANGQITLVMKVRSSNGRDVIDPEGTGILMETKTFPITVPPTGLVQLWLAPKCPTCGR
jgi:hypothetical protein